MTFGVQGYNNNYNYSYAYANSNTYQQNDSQPKPNQNPMQMLQGLAMIFAGLDMLDDGQINGSILKQLMGGQQQNPLNEQNGSNALAMAQAGQNGANAFALAQAGQNGANAFALAQAGQNGANAFALAQAGQNESNAFALTDNFADSFASAGAYSNNSLDLSNNITSGSFVAPTNNIFKSNNQVNISAKSKGEWGDPHFDLIGKNGKPIKFDHKGKDGHTYNLFKGDNLSVIGKYVPTEDPKSPQYVGEVSIQAGKDKFNLTKAGKASINGHKLEMKDGQSIRLEDGTVIKKVDGKNYQIISNDGDGKINISTSSGIVVDPEGNFGNLGGIIGTAIDQNRALSNTEANKFDMGILL